MSFIPNLKVLIQEEQRKRDFVLSIFNPTTIKLKIRYKSFEVRWDKLAKLPESRLGKIRFAASKNEILKYCDEIDIEKNEIYFDTSNRSFDSIIDYYYSEELHLDMNNRCILTFNNELRYWGIDTCDFSPCCSFKFHQLKEEALIHVSKMEIIETTRMKSIVSEIEKESFSNCYCPDIRRKMWDIMEYPKTSLMAKIFAMTSLFFIVTSTSILVISTIFDSPHSYNHTGLFYDSLTHNNIESFFDTIEAVYIVWFTFEFLLRFWASPNKCKFLKDPLNIIDIVSIAPFYLAIVLKNLPQDVVIHTRTVQQMFTIFRVLRIFRIFKLARHSASLKSLGQTISMSFNEFGILFMFLGIVVLLFSNLLYFAERDVEGTNFTSIPATFWWAVTTITTVGYGDIYPTTTIGKIVGGFCCIAGVLVLAMPISIIVDNFQKISDIQKFNEKALKYRKENLVKMEKKKNAVTERRNALMVS